jgi:hypothetical protein
MNNHPCKHNSCIMSSLRGLRNGVYYGGKIRFLHAVVMSLLFSKVILSFNYNFSNLCKNK